MYRSSRSYMFLQPIAHICYDLQALLELYMHQCSSILCLYSSSSTCNYILNNVLMLVLYRVTWPSCSCRWLLCMHLPSRSLDLHYINKVLCQVATGLTHCCQIFSIMHKINSVCNGLKEHVRSTRSAT